MSPNAQRVGGVLHGGVIMAVLDETMGFAALTLNDSVDQVTVVALPSGGSAYQPSSAFRHDIG
jgi:acyl-coenzyme A thioesterase PaaI-like protein